MHACCFYFHLNLVSLSRGSAVPADKSPKRNISTNMPVACCHPKRTDLNSVLFLPIVMGYHNYVVTKSNIILNNISKFLIHTDWQPSKGSIPEMNVKLSDRKLSLLISFEKTIRGIIRSFSLRKHLIFSIFEVYKCYIDVFMTY